METYPELSEVGEEQRLKNGEVIKRPGIVHRLDRETSGVMLIAKNQSSYQSLKAQFTNREIKKAYLALVYGVFKEDKQKGIIDLPIARSVNDFRQWSAQPGSRGTKREAVTEYFVLEQTEKYSLLFVQPKTGRTHQIRVHLKAVHHPIVCDSLYAIKKPCAGKMNRQALHSRAISWLDLDGIRQQVLAPLPTDYVQALEKLGFSYKSE